MMTLVLWLLAAIAIIYGVGHLLFAVSERLPIQVAYFHYRTRLPVLISMIIVSAALFIFSGQLWMIIPLLIQVVALAFSLATHQERLFDAVMTVEIEKSLDDSLLRDDSIVIVVELDGIARAYPKTFAAHHHLVNDVIGNQRVLISYCPMCNAIVVYNTTDYGLFKVAGFKNGNMIMGDMQTHSYWQQAMGTAECGSLQGTALEALGTNLLSWIEARAAYPNLQVAHVEESELAPFDLPIPGLWGKLLKSEYVPGLEAKTIDKRLPARTDVIGIAHEKGNFAYAKKDILAAGWQYNRELNLLLVASGTVVHGFYTVLNQEELNLNYDAQADKIMDLNTHTSWSKSGIYESGSLKQDLQRVTISDEFWYSWAYFHPFTRLLQVETMPQMSLESV